MTRLTRQLLVLCLALSIPAPAFAGDDDEPSAADIATARDLFRQGAKLAKEENWSAALDAYQRSMQLRPSNLTRYSIAVVQERMGRLVEAMENLRTFLAADHDSSTRRYLASARDMVRSLEGRIARIKVVIPGNPRGASVRIDGDPLPEAAIGVHRPSDPGKHRVEATVPGHTPFTKEVSVGEGEETTVVVELKAPDTPDAQTPAHEPVTPHPRGDDDTTGLILTAGGGGLFVLGLGVGYWGYSKAKNAETSDGSEADSAKTLALIGDIGMGVGLVAAGVGTYMLLTTEGVPEEPTSQVVVSPWAGQSAAGVAATGRF